VVTRQAESHRFTRAGLVRTAAGEVSADAIVCAAGAWSASLVREAGVDLPLTEPIEQELLTTDPLPPDTPPAIRRLLRRCLERDRRKRLSDIGDARLEIDEALAGPADILPAPPAAPRRRGTIVHRWATAALALAALGGVAVAVVHLREAAPAPAPVRFQVPPPPSSLARSSRSPMMCSMRSVSSVTMPR